MAEHFFILFEQGIDEENQAPGNMTNDFSFSTIGVCSLIIDAEPGDQSLIQLGPLGLLHPDCCQDDEEHGLFHFARPSLIQAGPVKRYPGLFSPWCPPKIRLELRRARKVGNSAHSRDDRRSKDRSDWRDRSQDLSLAALLHNLTNLALQLFEMALELSGSL